MLVECWPSCGVSWLKDGVPIDDDDERFEIVETRVDADVAKNDFASLETTLIWRLDSWPEGRLERVVDDANYTCRSQDNAAGEGVESTTYFRVQCKYIKRKESILKARLVRVRATKPIFFLLPLDTMKHLTQSH